MQVKLEQASSLNTRVAELERLCVSLQHAAADEHELARQQGRQAKARFGERRDQQFRRAQKAFDEELGARVHPLDAIIAMLPRQQKAPHRLRRRPLLREPLPDEAVAEIVAAEKAVAEQAMAVAKADASEKAVVEEAAAKDAAGDAEARRQERIATKACRAQGKSRCF